jgi:hypothetical protein
MNLLFLSSQQGFHLRAQLAIILRRVRLFLYERTVSIHYDTDQFSPRKAPHTPVSCFTFYNSVPGPLNGLLRVVSNFFVRSIVLSLFVVRS